MSDPRPVELTEVRAFVCVAEAGSMTQAALRLGVAKSIVSRRVSQLERAVGAVMLTRTARGTALTDAGRTYYAGGAAALAELEFAREAVGKLTTEISGELRISAPQVFQLGLAPLLADFAALHPMVRLEICFEDRQVDLISEGYDLAVRIGNLPDSSLITRRLATVRAVVVASPAYLDTRGRPSRPGDLTGHDVIVYTHATNQWRFRGAEGWEYVRGNPRLRTDSGQMVLAAGKAGLGVVILPWFMVEQAVLDGDLEQVLPAHPHEGGGLHLLMPPARARIARVRALVSFLADRFGPVI
ncbi:LysR family transcriptional regulator [Brevundimonas sp. Root1423]|uniref:LysR family transcriptional regulator n=1 Tax=Brevundimonas sp. Root1423 TaxID=1736462 RepID=UPI0006FA8D08|nr:LysR family transcriptional regulator [Brevundimonas sp. Root1423]KQY89792.1 LysR family transcriptional regulator [Brevundimonas sp. Root1423]